MRRINITALSKLNIAIHIQSMVTGANRSTKNNDV